MEHEDDIQIEGVKAQPLTVAQVKADPENVARAYNQLLDAVKEGRANEEKLVAGLKSIDAEIKALKQEKALSDLGRPEVGGEVHLRQFVAEDGRAILRGFEGKGAEDDWTPGLLDSNPVCEWQREFQDLIELRTIATHRGSGHNLVPTPKIDKKIRRHIQLAPAPLRKALEGVAQRLFSGASGAGSEWQQTLVLPRVEETLKVMAQAAGFFEEIQMGSKTLDWPFATTGLRPYIKGAPSVDNPAFFTGSTPATTKRSFTAVGMAVLAQILDDAEEDSIIAAANYIREQLAQAVIDGEEDAIFNGDTTSTHQDTIASWDIRGRWNSDGLGTSADHRRAWIGFRKRCLAIGSAAKLDSSSYTAFSGSSGLQAALELKLQHGSMNKPGVYFCSPEHFIKLIKSDTSLLTMEKYGANATIITGEVGKVGMTRIHRTQYLSADMNTSGIFDNTTKTKTGAVLVDPSRFKIFRRRGLSLETQKEIRNGVNYMVLTARETFGSVDADSTVNAVYAYNLAIS